MVNLGCGIGNCFSIIGYGKRILTIGGIILNPNPPPKKRKTPLRLMNQADRMFSTKKTFHQRGATEYVTRRVTIQV